MFAGLRGNFKVNAYPEILLEIEIQHWCGFPGIAQNSWCKVLATGESLG